MRSLLFVPADSARKLSRGPQSGADALILDLEDSVVPANPDGILLPKCMPENLRTLDHYLSAFEAASAMPLGANRVIAIATETPAAMFAVGGYAGVSPRLEGITWGAEDLAACLGGNNRRFDGIYDDVYRLARSLCLLGAAAAGVMPIDTIYTDFKDEAGLAAECAAAKRSGFSASEEELAWARKVVAIFAENPNAGTIALDGKMVDRPHLSLARRVLGISS